MTTAYEIQYQFRGEDAREKITKRAADLWLKWWHNTPDDKLSAAMWDKCLEQAAMEVRAGL